MRLRRSTKFIWLFASCIVFSQSAQAQTSNVTPRITEAVNNSERVPLPGSTHPWARPPYDRGLADDSLPLERILLVLHRSVEQQAALTTLLSNQQNPSSPDFHKWLTPERFGQLYGPADVDLRAVTDWLTSQGFQINNVSRGRGVIEFSGNAGLVRSAFRTSIHNYVVDGEAHWANASDPQIPAALAAVITGIESLNNFPLRPLRHIAGIFSRSRDTGEVKPVSPLFTFPGCASSCNALGPYDFATIYNVLPLWNQGIDGTGQPIAIAADSDINIEDVRDFRRLFGLPPNDPNVIVNGSDPGVQGDETEADLDVQWAGAVAKNAPIDLVVSATAATAGVILSSQYIVDSNVAPVMSVSFGLCELFMGAAGNQFISQLWQQAAAQGITVVVAAGDQGSAACDGPDAVFAVGGLAVSGLASTPYNTAVGGTDFNDISDPSVYWNTGNSSTNQASAKGYIPETTWNDSCSNSLLSLFGFSTNAESNCNNQAVQRDGFLSVTGAGGGFSNCTTPSGAVPSTCAGGYPKPSWQAAVGVPNDGKRDVPDVSLFSGNGLAGSFYIVCQADQDTLGQSCNLNAPFADFLGVGGTSAAAPAFAAVMAMVNQKTGSRQGNANPVLYRLAAEPGSTCPSAGTPAASCLFYDINAGTIAMPCLTGSPNCTTSNAADVYGLLSGYAATSNYDLATGLGSVNATNLVSNWSGAQPAAGLSSFNILSNTLTIDIPVAGQTGSATITVNGVGSFIGVVNLTCSVSPTPVVDPPTCSFNPATVTLGGATSSASSTLTIASTGSQSGSLASTYPPPHIRGIVEIASASMVCLILLFAAPQRRRGTAWLALILFVFLGAVVGCGGGPASGNHVIPGTPTGDYIVAITATSGTIKETTNVFVTLP